MGKVTKLHVEGRTREERISVRKHLGKLSQLTVQASTRKRYNNALSEFSSFLQKRNLDLPSRKDTLDRMVSDYVEFLWEGGYGRALASDTLAAIQDQQPSTKGCLQRSWRLLRTWNINEVPNRAPPLPEKALQAMVGRAFFTQKPLFGISLLLGYYGMLRTGELLSVKASHLTQPCETDPCVVSLGFTKGGKRQGAAESITVGVQLLTKLLWHWARQVPPNSNLCVPPHQRRKEFADSLKALKFEDFNFRPYSLRRGGSTFWFQQHGSLDRLLVQGRWASQKTGRLYVNEGLALLSDLTIPWNHRNKVFISQFNRLFHQPVPKLEPTFKKRRSGGRGARKKTEK